MPLHKNHTIPFTQQGYAQFKQEYEDLKASRPQAVKELARARDEGDRSENAAYKACRWRLSNIDYRLRFLQKLVDNGEVHIPKSTDKVEIGSTVQIKIGNRTKIFHIVGDHEADPQQAKISYKSPVGQALLNKKVDSHVTVIAPNGGVVYKITNIQITQNLNRGD